MLKKGDLILIAAIVVVIAAAFLISGVLKSSDSSVNKTVEISQSSKIIKTIDLKNVSKSEDIVIPGKYQNVVRVEQGRICFIESNCPDQVCVKTGWLQNSGDIAVCLPNQATIKIVGKADNIDVVSY